MSRYKSVPTRGFLKTEQLFNGGRNLVFEKKSYRSAES